MLDLSRTVRFCVPDDPSAWSLARNNTFSTWPPLTGLDRYYELTVTCRGEANPTTGYFINIKHIDTAVRDAVFPVLASAVRSGPSGAPLGGLMRGIAEALGQSLTVPVAAVELALTPRISLTLEAHAMDHVLLKQQYEFSAAHRLHVPQLSEQENRQVFGKCNNPAGHGHNYRLEVVARCPIDVSGRCLSVADLDAAVDEHVIERLDHKHLNVDVPEFAELNPSVEHIVRVIWGMLEGRLPGGAALTEVSVWETGKTVCTYRGPGTGVGDVSTSPAQSAAASGQEQSII